MKSLISIVFTTLFIFSSFAVAKQEVGVTNPMKGDQGETKLSVNAPEEQTEAKFCSACYENFIANRLNSLSNRDQIVNATATQLEQKDGKQTN